MLWKQFYLHICTLSNDSLFEWQLQCRETTHVHIIRNKLYWICCDLYKRCYFNHSIMLHILCMTLWEATVEITFHSRNQSFNYPFVFQFEMNTLFFLILFFFCHTTDTLLPFLTLIQFDGPWKTAILGQKWRLSKDKKETKLGFPQNKWSYWHSWSKYNLRLPKVHSWEPFNNDDIC